MMSPLILPDLVLYTFSENAYELLTSADIPTETTAMIFLGFFVIWMISSFFLKMMFRFTIHSWKHFQAKREMKIILKISAKMKSNAERLMKLVDEIMSIVQRYSNGVADYDGFALFKCLPELNHLQDLTYNVFMFENVVPFLKGEKELREDIDNAFQFICQKGCLTIFHDLGLDPNSDDIYAILIAFAIKKACLFKADINFVAVAGSDETRALRAKYLEKIAKEYNMDITNFGNYYFPIQGDIKPLSFITPDAMKKALDDLDTTSIQSMPSEQISGIVFFCGHLEKIKQEEGDAELAEHEDEYDKLYESFHILRNLSHDATVIAQTYDYGNFNIPKGDPLLSRFNAIHGEPFTIPWPTVDEIIPDVVKNVNKLAIAQMLTSEVPFMTKLSTKGSKAPPYNGFWKFLKAYYAVTTAFTRSLVIDNSVDFYNELRDLLQTLLE